MISFLLIALLSGTMSQNYAGADFPSPVQQAKQGVPLNQIKCNQGFVNIFKKAGGSPACVRLETALKLVNRNWGLMENKTTWFSYKIVGNEIPWSNTTIPYFNNNVGSCALGTTVTQYLKNQGINYFDARFDQYGSPNGPLSTGLAFIVPQNESSKMIRLGMNPVNLDPSVSNYDYFGEILPCVNQGQAGERYPPANPLVSGIHLSNTNSIRDTSFINLSLATNSTTIRQGQAVGVDIWISNTSGNNLTMNYNDNWPWKKLDLYPCIVGMPFGVALLEGDYSLQNLTEAKQLSLYQNGTYYCPMERYDQVNAYVFEPSSDNATLETPDGNFTSELRQDLSVNGFYDPANDFHALADGQYTIVAGDEWRHISLQHFTVSNFTQDVAVASIKMIPPFTPGGPIIQLTLENVGAKPITNIKAVLELDNNYTFDFTNVASSSPLIPGSYASNATMLIGGGFESGIAYPLVISGMEGNASFVYPMKVQIQG